MLGQVGRLLRMKRTLLLLAIMLAPPAGFAQAECFEDVGCTHNQKFRASDLRKLNCENLWFLRNSIFDDNGYCFKTEQGISAFGNDACRYHDTNSVPLNNYERYNVEAIRAMEVARSC